MRALFLAACLALLATAHAATEEKSALINFANDYANALTPAELNALEQQLAGISQENRYQIAVAIHPALPAGAERDDATELADKLLVGSSLDDRGLVIFVFLAEKVVRLEVGYGLEGLVPDAISHRIAERIAARIAKGELAPALGEAIEALKPRLASLDRIESRATQSEWLPDFVLATIDATRGAGFFIAHREEIPRQFASWWKAQDPGSRPIVAGIGGLLALFVALCLRPVLGGALFLLLPRRWTAPGAFYGLFFWGTDARLGRTLRGGGPALGKIDRASIAVDLLPYVWSAFVATGLLLGFFITVVGHPGAFGGAGAWARW